jgi:hypothetical protein
VKPSPYKLLGGGGRGRGLGQPPKKKLRFSKHDQNLLPTLLDFEKKIALAFLDVVWSQIPC